MATILPKAHREKKDSVVPRLLSYQELDILHALRGFCAFYVVVFHAKFILWSGGTEYLRAFPRAGWGPMQYAAFVADMCSSAGFEMVIFFFVLSGFFIRYAQLRKHRTIWNFYVNRVVRIYPPYLASLVVSAAVLACVAYNYPVLLSNTIGRELNAGMLNAWQELSQLTLSGLGAALLFLKPKESFFGYNSVYWSLLPEALFYLSVPIAFWRIKYYYALSAALYLFGMVAAAMHVSGGALFDYVFLFNGYFALGVGLYDIVAGRPGWLEKFRQVKGIWLVVSILLLAGPLVVTAALHLRTVSGALGAVLAVASISALLAGRVKRNNFLVRLFHRIGIFSFSLYLHHFPLLIMCYVGLFLLTGNMVNYARYYWLALPLVTLGCFVLYYFTERLAVKFFRTK